MTAHYQVGTEVTARAITLHQPYASLISIGAKTIETRSWSTKYRGPLLVHAAKRWDQDAASDLWAEHGIDYRRFGITSPVPLGAVVASCQLVDCVPIVAEETCTKHPDVPTIIAWSERHQTATWLTYQRTVSPTWYVDKELTEQHRDQLPFGDFSPGRYAWLLEDVKATTEPIPCRGRQGLWAPPPEVLEQLR